MRVDRENSISNKMKIFGNFSGIKRNDQHGTGAIIETLCIRDYYLDS